MSTPYCRHIRLNGRRCHAFAVHGQSFCFYHRGLNARHRALNPPDDGTQNIIHPLNLDPGQLQREPLLAEYFAQTRAPLELDFPTLDDRESIQVALSMLLNALGRNRIDPKRAATMLYGLQVASANARNLTPIEDNTVTQNRPRRIRPGNRPRRRPRRSQRRTRHRSPSPPATRRTSTNAHAVATARTATNTREPRPATNAR